VASAPPGTHWDRRKTPSTGKAERMMGACSGSHECSDTVVQDVLFRTIFCGVIPFVLIGIVRLSF
jgi:hypothetical protein